MKTLFSMFAFIVALLLISCSKEDSPGNNPSQRLEFSDNQPLSVEVINGHPNASIVKVLINNDYIDNPEGIIHTTAPAGKNEIKVVAYSVSGGSIVVTDSQGTWFCQSLEPRNLTEISFEDIIMNTTRRVVITYLSEGCPAL